MEREFLGKIKIPEILYFKAQKSQRRTLYNGTFSFFLTAKGMCFLLEWESEKRDLGVIKSRPITRYDFYLDIDNIHVFNSLIDIIHKTSKIDDLHLTQKLYPLVIPDYFHGKIQVKQPLGRLKIFDIEKTIITGEAFFDNEIKFYPNALHVGLEWKSLNHIEWQHKTKKISGLFGWGIISYFCDMIDRAIKFSKWT